MPSPCTEKQLISIRLRANYFSVGERSACAAFVLQHDWGAEPCAQGGGKLTSEDIDDTTRRAICDHPDGRDG